MEKFVIEGGRRLDGELQVQGSKNSALPILAAAAVTGKSSILLNCPRLRDTDAAMRILRHIGCEASRAGDAVIVCSDAPAAMKYTKSPSRAASSSSPSRASHTAPSPASAKPVTSCGA